MKKRFSLITILLLLTALAVSGYSLRGTSSAVAAGENHAGHDHGDDHGHDPEAGSPPAKAKDLDSLFEDGEDTGKAAATGDKHDDHAGHSDHAGHREDDTADPHAGHDHGASGEICPEHGVPEVEDALCHGDHLGDLQPGSGMLVRLVSAEVAEKAGIGVTRPQSVSLAAGVDLPGTAEFDRSRFARLAAPAAGTVHRLRVQPGARVGRGDVLVELSLPEVAALKAQLSAARARQTQTDAARERERDLFARGISSRQELELAEAEASAAQSAVVQFREQLQSLGLSTAALAQNGDGGAVLALRAPFAGTVISVQGAAGETAAPEVPLVTIADTSTLWVELALPEPRIHQARVGAPIEARFTGLPGTVFSGRIFQVGAALDERSRTLPVLAEVKNPDSRLKAGMFGTVRLLEGNEETVLAVPVAALQTIDGLSFVFVRREPDLFELRRVQPGARMNDLVPVLYGLTAGDEVVVAQGFALKSEVLKARLGASCADH